MVRAWIAALVAPFVVTGAVPSHPRSNSLRLGIYYFPAWIGEKDGSWAAIKSYPDKKPTIGWYDSGDQSTMARQLVEMGKVGIDYVAFDWYWERDHTHSDQAVRAYLNVPQRSVAFSLLWANDKPFSDDQWQSIVSFWIEHYFRSTNYLRVGGKPVVFVFSYQGMAQNAQANKTTVAAYISTAQALARKAGLPGLYMVADTDDLSTAIVTEEAPKAGFSAVSAYNLHRLPWRGERPGWYKLTQGYTELDRAYRANWQEGLRGPLPMVVPMISGWDRRPWGGSEDPKHDNSIASASQFQQHLIAARSVMLAQHASTKLGIVCCWNEYGEGSYVEPTVGGSTSKLDAIRRVFGATR